MQLANSPSPELKRTPLQRRIARALSQGHPPEAIARALSGGVPSRHRRALRKVLLVAASDEAYKHQQAMIAMGQKIVDLPEMTEALTKRAKRGRVDAIKLAYESSGYWSPRTQHDHEHSGEVQIVLKGSRPQTVLDEGEPVDATVVED